MRTQVHDLYPFSEQIDSKDLYFGAAHTFIVHIIYMSEFIKTRSRKFSPF